MSHAPAVEILEDLYFIERGYLSANHFVYRSEPPVLIDTAYVGELDKTARSLAALGVALTDVRLIVGTHCHCDHIGANRNIQDLTGCDIALHPLGKYFMDSRDGWSTWWDYFHQAADFFTCTMALEDGQRLVVGPHEFVVLHTPGHAADGIVLYHPQKKLLISSDTLWEKDMAVMTLRVEGSGALFQMLASLDKLAGLDIRRVYPGHGPAFDDAPAAIRRTRQRLHRFLGQRELIGQDLLKKIMVYSLMMHGGIAEESFFSYLMRTCWFKETIDFYFGPRYASKYTEIMDGFLTRGIVQRDGGKLVAAIKP
jgi:glyoxylase-like metal-dependent hydrolase (beta-lactamase superfamily II)